MTRKLYLPALIAVMGLLTARADAQAFEKGTNHICIGLGIGGYFTYASYGDYTSTPTFFASFDHGLVDDVGPGTIGIGAFLGYKSSSYTYDYFGYNWKGKWTDLVFGARGTYHIPLDNDNLDLYGALSLGIYLESYKFTSNDPIDPSYDTHASNAYYAFSVGGKYMFSDNFGVFAELGYDVAWIKAGICLGI